MEEKQNAKLNKT